MEVHVGGAPVDPVDDLDGSAPGALRCLHEGGLDVLIDNAGACLVGQVGTSVLTAGECHGTRLPSLSSGSIGSTQLTSRAVRPSSWMGQVGSPA